MARALAVYLGRDAAHRIGEHGWTPDLFDLLIGASGGAKWLILGHFDRVLFGDFLQRGTRPLTALGSSIGSWRHACLVQPDPVAAIARLEHAYLMQAYSSGKPAVSEISDVSSKMLEQLLGPDGVSPMVNHPRIRSHIVTARGRGPAGSTSNALLATAMGTAALGNSISRQLLQTHFQRVVFHSGEDADSHLHFNDFQTRYCTLREDNTREALRASGSIPFVLTGERNIAGAPPGHYWDGGIIDYHFDLGQYASDGLLLYPHFSANVVPGWFDKFLPWRKTAIAEIKKLALLCPTQNFIDDLPHGKIPDRSDFTRMAPDARVTYWQECIQRSRALAEEFAELLLGSDPLRGVEVLS